MSAPLALMKSWIELVLPIQVIYDGDDETSAPRPNVATGVTTYASIQFTSDSSPLSTATEALTDEPGSVDPTKYEQVRSLLRRGDLDVAIYGPGAEDYCRALELSYGRQDVLDLLNAAGDYAINLPTDVRREPILRSATREPEASIQFMVEWVEEEIFEMEAVASVEVDVDVEEEST
jgi:hypothetical protein